ncbi:uncharacterized protein [Drosophila pseudoobscura]|uniref:Uncharacterized protein n=1 Tax=Drosophila pseudoobscura pseudoobscura TaxID=46245 RepID=A0A6I8ULD6_DROPS|nr:uncharacterized protein LOC4818083 [Drosophila pseudoobscura]
MLKYLSAICLLVLMPILALQNGLHHDPPMFPVPGDTHIRKAQSLVQRYTNNNYVQVFCWKGEPFSFLTIFNSNCLHLEIEEGAEYSQYMEETDHKIHLAREHQQEWAEGKAVTAKDKYINLRANKPICYGIYTDHGFKLTLETTNTDKWRVTKFCLGFLLWRAAPRVGASRRLLYGLAAFLGLQLGTWITIYDTGHLRLLREGSLSTALHEVFYERPSMLVRAFCACWCALCLVFQRLDNRQTGRLNRFILRGIACWSIFSASDHQSIGFFCLACIFLHPIIRAMLRAKTPAGQENYQQQYAQRLQQQANLLAEDSFRWAIPRSASFGAGAQTFSGAIQTRISASQGTGQEPLMYHTSGDSIVFGGRFVPTDPPPPPAVD